MIAPVTSPKPPMMVAAKALSAIVEPIWIETNSTGATRMPATPPSTALVDESDHDHRRHGNAEQRRHLLVLRRRLQFLAEQRVLEEPVLKRDQQRASRP